MFNGLYHLVITIRGIYKACVSYVILYEHKITQQLTDTISRNVYMLFGVD